MGRSAHFRIARARAPAGATRRGYGIHILCALAAPYASSAQEPALFHAVLAAFQFAAGGLEKFLSRFIHKVLHEKACFESLHHETVQESVLKWGLF